MKCFGVQNWILTLTFLLIVTFYRFSIQLRIISDGYQIDGIINVDPNAVTLTDYYVLVTDDLNKVCVLILTRM